MPASDLQDRHDAVMPRWVSTYYDNPLQMAHASGRRVVDQEGREYLDFFGGIVTTSLGYDIAEVRDAVQAQLATGVVHSSTLYLIESQITLAERIAELSGIRDPAVFFVNSGTEANETALLAACCHGGSNHVVALQDSYHGRSFGAAAVSSLEGWQPSPYRPFALSWASNGWSTCATVQQCISDLEARLSGIDTPVAALIAEPVQGLGGFRPLPAGLLRGYQEVVAARGGVLICDEVQTGWGRTGRHWWGHQAHGVTPELITFAKGVANGFAIGGVVGSRPVLDSIGGKSISTFGGNPLAPTAALATVDYLLRPELRHEVEETGQLLLDGLQVLAERYRAVGDVRGYGLMLALDIIDPATSRPAPATTGRILAACRERGLLVGIGGRDGATLRLSPAMTLTTGEAKEALDKLTEAVAVSTETTETQS